MAFARAAYSAKALFASVDPVLEARGLSFSHATRKVVMPSTINPVARRDSFRTANSSWANWRCKPRVRRTVEMRYGRIRPVRKDHKDHKDRRTLTEANEANEGLSNATLTKASPLRYLRCLLQISSVFVVSVIFPYCDLILGRLSSNVLRNFAGCTKHGYSMV